jgi:hypothetical protein
VDYITFGGDGLACELRHSVFDHSKFLEVSVAFVADVQFDMGALAVADVDVDFSV